MASAILTIAGSDPTSGAGLQADLKVFKDFGLYGVNAITAITVQNTRGVEAIHALDRSLFHSQLDSLIDDVEIRGCKLGMLASEDIADDAALFLFENQIKPIVIDPVFKSTSGFELFPSQMVSIYVERLLPLATAITPNRAEAELLLKQKIDTLEDSLDAASSLSRLGPDIVCITGIDHDGGVADAINIKGSSLTVSAEKTSVEVHGTGCIYSAALLSALILDHRPELAVRSAHAYTQKRIHNAMRIGHGSLLSP